MSSRNKLVKAIQNLFRQMMQLARVITKTLMNWLLRSLLIIGRRSKLTTAGFLLPTVTMVILVVILLTTAMMFRAFDRSKNASNIRVDTAVLAAGTPAIDRAKAKIAALFTDPTLPRSTPGDSPLYEALTSNIKAYTLGDEVPLKLGFDIDKNGGALNEIGQLEKQETLKTAWRYPVDTDNDGKFDSFTLYGIFFRSPTRTSGNFDRPRKPLEARTPPLDDSSSSAQCPAAQGTSASLVGDTNWQKLGSKLKKSFYVFTATVPITDKAKVVLGPDTDTNKYQEAKTKGFSALEFQQDQTRIPLTNNAVVYEDDLEIAPGAGLKLNGRIVANANLLTGKVFEDIKLYQVSSPDSCFFEEENSRIVVGGNVGNGRITGEGEGNAVQVDLFNPDAKVGATPVKVDINSTNKSVTEAATDIAYNSQAYAERLNLLVVAQVPKADTTDPSEVKNNISKRQTAAGNTLDPVNLRREELEIYFGKRLRRVPFKEVAFGASGVGTETAGTVLLGSGDSLRPLDKWVYPFDFTNNNTSNTGLTLQLNKLAATEPQKQQEVYKGREDKIGDRILVGNNLPFLWYDTATTKFIGKDSPQKVLPTNNWDDVGNNPATQARTRTTRVDKLTNLNAAVTERDGLMEQKAAEAKPNPLDNQGGLRIVTGAGIYVDDDGVVLKGVPIKPRVPNSFLPTPALNTGVTPPLNLNKSPAFPNIYVWPDSMPMTVGAVGAVGVKGDLLMRATAVYHYTQGAGAAQLPIACVSSYYNPTNAITAQNEKALLANWINPSADKTAGTLASPGGLENGKSNNGIVYAFPGRNIAANLPQLNRQAQLVFPDGRIANEPLRNALETNSLGKALSLAENSAIDTAICAIELLKSPSPAPMGAPPVPHGAIYETTFLDAREIKSIGTAVDPFSTNYDRSLELRQPLEVRATVLDVNLLRTKTIAGGPGGQEYLIPNSGIIYATRDDALLDKSDNSKLVSPTDYKLDPTRRPNAIVLTNGSNLSRQTGYRPEEKGFILASNLPAYVKGDFNLHSSGEEFKGGSLLADTWSNFYARTAATINDNFACRTGDPRLPNDKCTTGDTWRSATVLADAVTLLSNNYRFGFRNEGDFDLRNNVGNAPVGYDFNGNGSISPADPVNETVVGFDLNGNKNSTDISVLETQITATAVQKLNGFFDNNFLSSADWFQPADGFPKDFDIAATATGIQGSSYVNNFVTPIQRRVVGFPEYLMEMCTKVPVSSCTPADWSVDGAGMKASIQINASYDVIGMHKAGTTADLAYDSDLADSNPEFRRYARRVAFQRTGGNLNLDANKHPIPLGIDGVGKIQAFPGAGVLPRIKPNAPTLWYQTTPKASYSGIPLPATTNYAATNPLFYKTANGLKLIGNDPKEQPLLVPVLQIHTPTGTPGSSSFNPLGISTDTGKNWMQTATETKSNLVAIAGDTPARPTESNGGLENFVRFLENWENVNSRISGSLIQYKRSAYATGPWQTIQLTGSTPKGETTLFGTDYRQVYRTRNTPLSGSSTEGMSPFYYPPNRQWGYDVGLLSQLPDLITQQFTQPPTTPPSEYFREVNRDDPWIETLLCAATADAQGKAAGAAINANQRPSNCPTIP
ncbi:hormogonium polysaccharide biosynthesis protein HpsA [Coleofasciculus sp. H7-2]|uniref:hormogonium polysaccharide biosynthesis protein HpsA n=1 Tax=Coleofasciculus sp. H7-2 TaxID=3351545 RepID=UPI00366F5F6F